MMQTPDLIWTSVGFILTLLVFSYFLGDNLLFRLATYIFVGVAAGYVFVLTFFQVIIPRLVMPVLAGDLLAVAPILLGVMLLAKVSPRLAGLGNIPMAYLVGVGAAVTVGGAVLGTLFGQLRATTAMFDLRAGLAQGSNLFFQILEGGFILFGTLVSLVYFSFRATGKANQPLNRPKVIEYIAFLGKIFIAITLGALFAGVYAAAVAALVERMGFLLESISFFLK